MRAAPQLEVDMFGKMDNPETSRCFVRMVVTILLPFTVVWLIVAWWLGLTSIWWLMAPPMLLFVLIGWMREPGRGFRRSSQGSLSWWSVIGCSGDGDARPSPWRRESWT